MKIYALLFALVATLALSLAACGGDDNASSTPTHASTVTATAAPTVASGPFFDCAAAHPDLVVPGFTAGSDIVSGLKGGGITVLTQPSPSDINGVYDDIELMGKVTGHAGEADALVTSMSNQVRAISTETAGKTPPTV